MHKAAIGRRMGPFRARVEKLEESNLHLAPDPANIDQEEEEKLPDAVDMDQSLWFFQRAWEHPQPLLQQMLAVKLRDSFFSYEIYRDASYVWIKNRV